MKTIFAILILLHSSASFALDDGGKGGAVGNGGEGMIGPEFTYIAYRLASAEAMGILYVPRTDKYTRDGKLHLGELVFETSIGTTDQPLLMEDGTAVAAMNFPDQHKIVVSSAAWILMDCKQKHILVLHELLGLIGYEKSQNYAYSTIAIVDYFSERECK